MAARDPRIDAFIAKSAPFAGPILEHLRELVHKGCPEVEETMKWNFPFFQYRGSILCNMAAFKQHCSFGFWQAPLMQDPAKVLHRGEDKGSAGHFGHLKSIKDLPSDKILVAYIKEACGLIEVMAKGSILHKPAPKKQAPKKASPKKEMPVPGSLSAALKKNKKAAAAWEGFPPSHRKEYIEWVTEAKTEETRQKRIATTIGWLVEGKSRNWKYQR